MEDARSYTIFGFVIAYMVMCIAVGLWAMRRTRNTRDFFMAGRHLGMVVTSVAVYGLRGVYFALLEEGAVPAVVTGTAVGLVSVLGYSPDVFFGVLAGWLIDSYPGVPGYRYFCFWMVGFAAVGLVASGFFTRRTNRSLHRQKFSP